MAVFDFTDASLKGDPKWASAARWTGYAPFVVITLALLSIVQIVLGVVWITSIQSRSQDLTFGQVIQPLIVPGLSFFNTIPSIHLHVLARSNHPLMAIIFSSILGAIYLASAVVFLPPCASGDSTWFTSSSYQRTECPIDSRRGVWAAIVALQFLSAVLYFVHVAMAWKVRRALKQRESDEREGIVMPVVDEEAKAKREEEARRRWMAIRDL